MDLLVGTCQGTYHTTRLLSLVDGCVLKGVELTNRGLVLVKDAADVLSTQMLGDGEVLALHGRIRRGAGGDKTHLGMGRWSKWGRRDQQLFAWPVAMDMPIQKS